MGKYGVKKAREAQCPLKYVTINIICRGEREEMVDAINLNKQPWQVQVHFIATT